jgi:hypothetical protein
MEGQTVTTTDQRTDEQMARHLAQVAALARRRFPQLGAQEVEELAQEAQGQAWVNYRKLQAQGRAEQAFGPEADSWAVLAAAAGRHVGGSIDRVADVLSRRARKAGGFKVESIPQAYPDAQVGITWAGIELAAADTDDPAETVPFAIDWCTFEVARSERERQIISLLADGNSAVETARLAGVSAARVGQIRQRLDAAWREFQGE